MEKIKQKYKRCRGEIWIKATIRIVQWFDWWVMYEVDLLLSQFISSEIM